MKNAVRNCLRLKSSLCRWTGVFNATLELVPGNCCVRRPSAAANAQLRRPKLGLCFTQKHLVQMLDNASRRMAIAIRGNRTRHLAIGAFIAMPIPC
jgi:hypothetical protein